MTRKVSKKKVKLYSVRIRSPNFFTGDRKWFSHPTTSYVPLCVLEKFPCRNQIKVSLVPMYHAYDTSSRKSR
jgi:hypothetical protein